MSIACALDLCITMASVASLSKGGAGKSISISGSVGVVRECG